MAQLRVKSVEPSARTGATRAGSPAPSEQPLPADQVAAPVAGVPGSVVRWGAVARVVRALAETAAPAPSSWRALETLAIGLTEPLRRLDQLALDVGRAVSGDDHAATRVRATIAEVATLSRRADLGPVLDPGPVGMAPHGIAPAPAGLLDETELTTVLLGVAHLARPDDDGSDVDAVALLAIAAGTLGSLVVAHDDGGPGELVAALESLIATGALGWAAPRGGTVASAPHDPRGGTVDHAGQASGDDPAAAPDDDRAVPTRPVVGDPLGDLLAQLRTRPHWDPDLLDHVYPWWDPPVEVVDPRWWDEVRGFLQVRRRLTEHAEPAPERPPHAVWSDGIAAVEIVDGSGLGRADGTDVGHPEPAATALGEGGASVTAGAATNPTVAIVGTGFGARQPAGVALLLPTARGCRPAVVLSWSDTRITAAAPADVVSGSVGFADAGYVARYDAWADRRRAADAVLADLPCVRAVPLLTAPFHECPPPTPATWLRAGAPAITAFSANGASVLGLEPGIPLRLRWSVRNVESLTVERTSDEGPLLDGATTLVDPSAASIALGVPSNRAPQVWTYRLTATGTSGPPVSRTVTVVAGKRPGLRIESIEVTQSVRPVPEPDVLVETKPTVVRVLLRHGLAGFGNDMVPNVRGRVRVRGPEIGVSPWFDAALAGGWVPVPTPGASITVRGAASGPPDQVRDRAHDTLTFLVPPAWARGAATSVDVEVRVEGFGAAAGFAGYRERVVRSVGPFAFEPRRALQLRYIRVAWDSAAPSAEECRSTLTGVVPLLPTPTAGIAEVPGVGIQTVTVAAGSDGRAERRALLDDWAERRACTAFEPLAEWLGFDPPEDDGAIWVLVPGRFVCGEAFSVPGSVCLTPPNDSPYAAHELAHCLARRRTDPAGASAGPCPSASGPSWSGTSASTALRDGGRRRR